MWPILLDMTREESMHNLRCLELDAFAGLVTAFRAQGSLNTEKLRLLKATGSMLNISSDRHKAEIRRAVNDEKLNTIAYHITGHKTSMEDWTQEGRRLIPLLSRVAPQTVYSAIADEVADSASRANKLLPHPACTERKRSAPVSPTPVNPSDSIKVAANTSKVDDIKKRKISANDSNVLNKIGGSQLMGPPKATRTPPLNRLRAKMKQKDNLQILKIRQQHDPGQLTTPYLQQYAAQSAKVQVSPSSDSPFSNKTAQTLPITVHLNNASIGKINVHHNISIQPSKDCTDIVETTSNLANPLDSNVSSLDSMSASSNCLSVASTEHNKPSLAKALLPNKMIKVCPQRKTVTTSTGQKLVVVSNPQSIPSTSILQRTLTIPFVKNICVKNYDKFKIVPPANTVQISPLFASNATSGLNHLKNSSKHKVVTVRTNGSGHNNSKVLPFNQIQMLNTKGAIKVLPFGSKLLTKQTPATNTSSPIYLVNSVAKTAVVTNVTTDAVTPPVIAIKSQMPAVKSPQSVVSMGSTNHTAVPKSDSPRELLHALTEFESEFVRSIVAGASVDESSSESSEFVFSNCKTTYAQNLVELNHMGNHVVEEEDDDEDERDAECDEEDEDGEANTNDSCKVEESAVPAEEQSFYILENEDGIVETEISIDQPPCAMEQLDSCPYPDELRRDEMHLQEELVTFDCTEPTIDPGITTDAVLDFETFES